MGVGSATGHAALGRIVLDQHVFSPKQLDLSRICVHNSDLISAPPLDGCKISGGPMCLFTSFVASDKPPSMGFGRMHSPMCLACGKCQYGFTVKIFHLSSRLSLRSGDGVGTAGGGGEEPVCRCWESCSGRYPASQEMQAVMDHKVPN